jgi:hypothetical protein
MRKVIAVTLVPVGLLLAIAGPVLIGALYNIDFGDRPRLLLAAMIPGITIMALASKLWRGGGAPALGPEQVPPGHRVCELCKKVVPVTEGADRRLDEQTLMAQTAFVCHRCASYRTKRALRALVVLVIGGALILAASYLAH